VFQRYKLIPRRGTGQFRVDVAGGHQECRGEPVRLSFDHLGSGVLGIVHDEMAEFVCCAKSFAVTLGLVIAEDDDRPVGEWDTEGIDCMGADVVTGAHNSMPF
jgi:hypothetical protein